MDRSFLLQKEVIEASRDFVCIRLATYEDKEEVDYLSQVFRGRAGTLENTVFAMLSPDARQYLTRTGRGPQWAFRDAADMAASMKRFAADIKPADSLKALPAMKDIRLALNVAACDNMPVAVAVSDEPTERKALSAQLAEIAWSKEMIGRCAYSVAATTDQMKRLKIHAGAGIYIIEPDRFGVTGKVLARLDPGSSLDELSRAAVAAVTQFRPPSKEARSHIADGTRQGVYWKTATPVTDPHGPRRPEPPTGGSPR